MVTLVEARLHGRLTTWDAVRVFIFAGNARFTLVSLKTGMRYTYRVRVRKKDVEQQARRDRINETSLTSENDAPPVDLTYFVSLLRGTDNDNDYAYMGVLRQDLGLRLTGVSRMGRSAPAVVGLVWFLDAMKNGRAALGTTVEFWHEGRCGRCGRSLTVPESVLRGIGPECAGRAS
jgi:hypothetical protein